MRSATVPPPIAKLAERYMRDAQTVNFSPTDVAVETIEQFYFTVDPQRKFDLLVRLLAREEPRQAIIFCRTKRGTEKIFQRLSKKFQEVACMHGDMNQSQRESAVNRLRRGQSEIIVATDVAARGWDVERITHVINFDLPNEPETYVHRSGRTGRAGASGIAISFCSGEERDSLRDIERLIRLRLRPQGTPELREVEPRREPATASRPPRRLDGSAVNPRPHQTTQRVESNGPKKRRRRRFAGAR